jgi:ABC-type branched-subunit amino acid transport system substrate-binding protein
VSRARSRRAFLRTALGGAAMAVAVPRARAAEAPTLGLIVPPAGPAAAALTRGAALGLDDANALAALFGKRLRLLTETAADGPAAAAAVRALAGAGAMAVVGGAGVGVASALGDAAAGGALLALNVAAPDEALRNDRCQRRLFHLAPSVTMLVDALARWLAGRRALRWAVVTDGGPRGVEIEAAVRRAARRQEAALGAAQDGADVTFIGLEGAALREALSRARAGGRLVAGIGDEAPAALGPDEAGGVWAVGWHHELERFSARELNARFRRRFAAPLDEVSWAAWAAVKLVGEAVVRAGAADGAALAAFFQMAPPFDGHKGTALTFRPWDRQLRQPLYILSPRRREEIGDRRGTFAVVADSPGADLDALGTTAAESRCQGVTR